jgi:hypothetical protein
VTKLKIKTFIAVVSLTGVFALPTTIFPQFSTPTSPERIKLVVSIGIEDFVKELNSDGQLGYQLVRSLNYGGEGPTQRYAAVLRLDVGNKYEYDWLSSPDKNLLEGRLNYQAKRGFNFITSYALTSCSDGSSKGSNPTSPDALIFRLKKGEGFLLERKNGRDAQTKEYKIFVAKVHLGDHAEETIQAGLDAAAPQGFRPIKILFTRQGLLDFSLSVITERNLENDNLPKVEYRFLKKTSSFPKDVDALAAQGFRFITGRRVGMVNVALLAKRANVAAAYTFVDEKKYAKVLDITTAKGNSYEGLMAGELTCGSTEVENEKFVFAQDAESPKHEYKTLDISVTQNNTLDDRSMIEFRRLMNDGYQVKEIFYFGGLKLILEN